MHVLRVQHMSGEACIDIKLKYKMFFVLHSSKASKDKILRQHFSKCCHIDCVSQIINSWEELPKPAGITCPTRIKEIQLGPGSSVLAKSYLQHSIPLEWCLYLKNQYLRICIQCRCPLQKVTVITEVYFPNLNRTVVAMRGYCSRQTF